MKTQSLLSSFRARQSRGIALLITLWFVALITILVVSYFALMLSERQISNSSASQTKADFLARSALNVIVGDFQEEIAQGSTVSNGGASGNPQTYLPTSAATSVPARIGVPVLPAANSTTAFPYNLIRRSVRASDPTATPVPNTSGIPATRASAVNSTNDPSLNGRTINLARWNSHYLLPLANPSPSNTTDSTPLTGASGFTPPDWVFVTGNGPTALTTPDPTTIGRYAYAVYDEGGLIDVNVAGYPSSLQSDEAYSPADPNNRLMGYGAKGSVAFADLTRLIPLGTASSLSAAQIDTLLGWRNYATLQPASGTMSGGYNFSANTAANALLDTRYFKFVSGNDNGFLSINPNSFPFPVTATSRTDQAIPSRQQLIQLWRAMHSPPPPSILEYFGTFSREVNAPTFVPSPTRAKVGDSGLANDTSLSTYGIDDQINPSLADFRATDGTVMLKQRFPLSRLAWITSDGPSASLSTSDVRYNSEGTAANILTCFGLTWDPAPSDGNLNEKGWIYNHGSATSIYTFQEINANAPGRQPDFFELLQATIGVGSLAKNANIAAGLQNGVDDTCQDVFTRDRALTYHILKIGASIIDQSNAENYPTLIKIMSGNNPLEEIFGVKNLPYLNKIVVTAYWTPGTQTVNGWFRPSLWNPHQPAAVTSSLPMPTVFRIVASGLSSCLIAAPPGQTGDPDTTPITTDTKTLVFTADPSNLNFTTEELINPTMVQSGSSPDCNGPVPDPANPSLTSTWSGFLFASGLWNGVGTSGWNGDPDHFPPGDNALTFAAKCDKYVNFTLQYQDAAGQWRDYDRMEDFNMQGTAQYSTAYMWHNEPQAAKYAVYNPADLTEPSQGTQPYQESTGQGRNGGTPVAFRVDPRTDRFGCDLFSNSYPTDGGLFNNYGINPPGNLPQGASIRFMDRHHPPILSDFSNKSVTGFYINSGPSNESMPGLLFFNQSAASSSGTEYYADADGVVRQASGAYLNNSTFTGTPMSEGSWNSGAAATTQTADIKPVILNRPFRSVAEFGHAFRDLPWKDIDFFTQQSADAALLDVFTINKSPVVAGNINLNTRNLPVLTAIINNTLYQETATPTSGLDTMSSTDASAIASQVVSLSATQPFQNCSELVTRLAPALSYAAPTGTNPNNNVIKSRREAAIRALADVSNTRTWNLLIDVIAQSGKYPPNATSLSNFVVEGERRYWLHVAIDRYTGQVVDQYLEPVYE